VDADGSRDLLRLVRDDLACDDAVLDPGGPQRLLARGPPSILTLAGGDAVGYGDDGDADRALLPRPEKPGAAWLI
jgi:hypothetical protein